MVSVFRISLSVNGSSKQSQHEVITMSSEEIADLAIDGFHYHSSVYGKKDNATFLVE